MAIYDYSKLFWAISNYFTLGYFWLFYVIFGYFTLGYFQLL